MPSDSQSVGKVCIYSARSHELLPRKCFKTGISRLVMCRSSPQDLPGGCFALLEGPGCKNHHWRFFDQNKVNTIATGDRIEKNTFRFDTIGRLDRI